MLNILHLLLISYFISNTTAAFFFYVHCTLRFLKNSPLFQQQKNRLMFLKAFTKHKLRKSLVLQIKIACAVSSSATTTGKLKQNCYHPLSHCLPYKTNTILKGSVGPVVLGGRYKNVRVCVYPSARQLTNNIVFILKTIIVTVL